MSSHGELQAVTRRQLRVPPFSGVPLEVQRDFALVAWTALETLPNPAGRVTGKLAALPVAEVPALMAKLRARP